MKKSIYLLAVSAVMILTNGCSQNKNSHSPVVGNWKMNAIHIQQYDAQLEQLQGQLKIQTDSLGYVTDTASQRRIMGNRDMYQHYHDDMQSRKDSSLKNTYWNFMSDGKFEGQESFDKKYQGYWSYNEKTKTVTRYLPSDSVKVDVKGDTLILNLDSVNQITFLKTSGK